MEPSSEDKDITGTHTYLLGQIDANVKTLLDHTRDHEERLVGLERWRWKLAGIGIALFAVATKGTAIAAFIGLR